MISRGVPSQKQPLMISKGVLSQKTTKGIVFRFDVLLQIIIFINT